MKILTYLLLALVMITGCDSGTISPPRWEQKIDFAWLFHLGDVENAEAPEFDDHDWRLLDLPHDFSIEQGFDTTYEGGWRAGYTKGGLGWYRKNLDWQPEWEGKKVVIQFDGIYMNSDVWINGNHLGHRPYGYIGFAYDLTPYLKTGKNIIAVRADNSKIPSGRWYTGSGIYRHVWLKVMNQVHVAQWGTFITTPEVNLQQANTNLQIQIRNNRPEPVDLEVQTKIMNPTGEEVTSWNSTIDLPAETSKKVTQQGIIEQPQLWSPDQPVIYQAETRLYEQDQLLDVYLTNFGIRTIEVNAAQGFLLNGQKLHLKGLCNHHDGGPVGAAVPDDLLYYRLKMLKDMGANAVRTAHNPAAPELYAICDTLGLMVMDEPFDGWHEPKAEYDYGHFFAEWWERDLMDFLLRDRNHPSIVMWSVGNEVPDFTPDMQKSLVDFVHAYDQTRPVTQARGYMGPHLDVAGFNGHGEEPGYLEKFHAERPDQPVVGTEMTHTLQTRGVYQTQTAYRRRDFPAIWEDGQPWGPYAHRVHKMDDLSSEELFPGKPYPYQSSYDNAYVRINVRDMEKMVRNYDFLMGSFRWTGFDYLGEATIQPARTANFGIIDLANFPKDHYYLYQSLWSDQPMVHLLPHWTHPGMEGTKIPVVVYTNGDAAELFLNGKSLGEKPMSESLQIVWQVPYEPGELKVVAKRNGQEVAEKSYRTAGKAAAIQLESHRSAIRANRTDLALIEVTVTDSAGTMVPEANYLVKFEVDGPAKIIGVENGDILDFDPVKASQRKVFKGKCLVILQNTGKPGEILFAATNQNLKPQTIRLNAVPY